MPERRRSIQPLDGGFGGYIVTLDRIRAYVEEKRPRSREDVKLWYVQSIQRSKSTTDAYIDSLFRCGLLREDDRVRCVFPRRRDKGLKIIKIIDANIVFILDMLFEARDGASQTDLHAVGKVRYGLGAGSNVNQVWWRRGWLESAGMLEVRDGLYFPTDAGRGMLVSRGYKLGVPHGMDLKRKVNRGEFGGQGEGPEHKSLKNYVLENCDRILSKATGQRVVTKECEMEHRLPSGDSVDVTGSDQQTVWHVEVKSHISEPQDIARGIYQCIKYAAVGKALERLKPKGRRRKVRAVLVVERALPKRLARMAAALKVSVFELKPAMQRALGSIRG